MSEGDLNHFDMLDSYRKHIGHLKSRVLSSGLKLHKIM